MSNLSGDPCDFDLFDPENSDKEKIAQGAWVPCRICWEAFMRLRPTARYCMNCERAFCEGEHGNFIGGKHGVCVRCLTGKEQLD